MQPGVWQCFWVIASARRWDFGVEADLAAEVEDAGLAVEDGGDDPGLAGEPAGGAGGEAAAGVDAGGS